MGFEVYKRVVIPKGDYTFISYRAEINTAAYRKAQVDLSYRFGLFYGDIVTTFKEVLLLSSTSTLT